VSQRARNGRRAGAGTQLRVGRPDQDKPEDAALSFSTTGTSGIPRCMGEEAPLLVGIVAMMLGCAIIMNARRLEACSVRIHRRTPHLLPLRVGTLREYRMYVWVNRIAGAVVVCVGAALLLMGLLNDG
jgi:hypothetical protein